MTTTETAAVPAVTEPRFQARTPVALPRPQAPAAVPANDRLATVMAMADKIAAAGAAVPKDYARNPGAVVLAIGFAEARGHDILTVLANVSFLNGKPLIDATFQRAEAIRLGYDVRITHADEQSATAEVWRGGEKRGEATYTIEHARAAGLAGKQNWRQNPEDMLVARATTRAIRRHAPDVMTGVLTRDEAEDQDPTTVAAQPAAVAAIDPAPVQPAQETAQEPTLAVQAQPEAVAAPLDGPTVIDADVVDEPTLDTPTGPWTDSEELKAALRAASITQTAAIQTAQQIDPSCGSLAMVVASPEASAAVQALIEGGA